MKDSIKKQIDVGTMLPACAQGAVGIECKTDDVQTNEILAALHDTDTAARVHCERSLNAKLGGSCQTPIAAYAELKENTLHLRALVGTPDGSRVLTAQASDHRDNAKALGEKVALELIDAGAQGIIDALAIPA